MHGITTKIVFNFVKFLIYLYRAEMFSVRCKTENNELRGHFNDGIMLATPSNLRAKHVRTIMM